MPSSPNRRRVEIPTFLFDRIYSIARTENRPISALLTELLHWGLERYHPAWVEDRDRERFNERAQRVLDHARRAANALQQDYVGTGHLLLGLIEEHGGVAADVLAALGVTADAVRAAIVQRYGRGSAPVTESLGFTARARLVLGLAMEEAELMGGTPVRTEHILLALVRYGGGLGVEILDQVGVLGRVRVEVLHRLGRPLADDCR